MSELPLSVYSELRPDHGEDAEPLLHAHAETRCRCLAVFDGMGGAGALASGSPDGRSEAFRAARLARGVVAELAGERSLCAMDVDESRQLVERSLRDAFRADPSDPDGAASRTRLISKMIRRLPTTLAMAVVASAARDVVVRALWVGDSRVYALTPADGLMQLTRDHVRYPRDAFDALYDDPPLSNCISADGEFSVEAVERTFRPPVLVFAATDGVFGYWRSPMHFESALLTSLRESASVDDWEARLGASIESVAADDASMAAVVVTMRGLRSFSRAFHRRSQLLRSEYVPAGEDADAADLRGLWLRYRRSYETWIPSK